MDSVVVKKKRVVAKKKNKKRRGLTGSFPGNTPVSRKTRAQQAVPFTSLHKTNGPQVRDVVSCIQDPPSVDVTMRSKRHGGSLLKDVEGGSMDDFYFALSQEGSDRVLQTLHPRTNPSPSY